MRPTAVAVFALLAAPLRADPPTVGTITSETIILRAAPKAESADTGSLARGASVIVHHAEGDDWLAIQPPNGAVSWINHLHVDGIDPNAPFPQNGTVAADGEVRLAAGKPGVPTPLDVRRTRIPDGSIVQVLGPKKSSDDSSWYPIAAPADDFRFVPKSAVRLAGAVGPGFVVKSPTAGQPEWTAPGGTSAKKPANGNVVWPAPTHPLWAEAERAEAAGQLDKAEELYFKLAREMNAPGGDPDLANLCYARVHALRERKRRDGGTVERPKPTAEAAPKKPLAGPGRAEWTGAGELRVAGRSGGRLYYALVDDRGRTMAFAVPGNGRVDLDRYRGKTVDLFGPVTFPEGFEKAGLVTVERVDVIR